MFPGMSYSYGSCERLPRDLFAIIKVRLRVTLPIWNTNVQKLATLRLVRLHDDFQDAGHADFDPKIGMLPAAKICLQPLLEVLANGELGVMNDLLGDTASCCS